MPNLAAEEAEKLRAFEQRMQLEGAAAFADGPAPWEQWQDAGTLGTYRVWRDSAHRAPQAPAPRKPLTTRLLTGLAQLAVLALLVGTAGVYLSIVSPEHRLAGNGVQPPPVALAEQAATDARPVMRDPAQTLARGGAAVEAAPPDTTGTEPTPGRPNAEPSPVTQNTTLAPPVAAVVALHPEQAPSAASPDPAADLALALDDLPGTAAGPLAGTIPAPAALEPGPDTQSTAQAAPGADTLPQQVALFTPPVDTLPEKPAARPAPAGAVRDLAGTWVINLASYNFESMAQRKLDAFRDKGVNAELVKITVKGKPMIRIRTTGYESRREASDWVALLEERLQLEGAWVARYQPGEE